MQSTILKSFYGPDDLDQNFTTEFLIFFSWFLFSNNFLNFLPYHAR